jgi:hypothetical protein
VFVAGDLLWYPVEGEPTIRMGPDVMVAVGRRQGDRGSFKQWEEGNVAPQVVVEVRSPVNRPGEMEEKFQFFERFGVEEFFVYDPEDRSLQGWVRVGDHLEEVPNMSGFVSPRLGIRFEPGPGADNLKIFAPDRTPFLTFAECVDRAHQERQRADEQVRLAQEQAKRARDQARSAQEQARLAQAECERAHQEHRPVEDQRALYEQERQRVARLSEQLRRIGVDPDSVV